MKALVTGSAGFIGNHFYWQLLAEGYTVLGCDTRAMSPMDCRDGFRRNLWSDVELVVHCAATIPAIDERAKSGLAVANDLAIDAEMFQWAARVQPKQLVYFSSCTAYPKTHQDYRIGLREHHIRLDHLHQPDSMYGFTKLAGELQAEELRKLGVDVRVFRPFSGYGTDQSLNYPFPSMIDRAVRRDDPFEVWGDGHQVRDFVHVDDIVNTVIATLSQPDPGPVNIGTGRPTTMIELAELIIDQVRGYTPFVQTLPDKPAGSRYLCADTTKLLTVREPTITLEEGIERALRDKGTQGHAATRRSRLLPRSSRPQAVG